MVRSAIHYFYPSHSTTFIIVLLSSLLILLSRPPESKFDSNSLGSWTRMIPECFPQVAKRVRTHLPNARTQTILEATFDLDQSLPRSTFRVR